MSVLIAIFTSFKVPNEVIDYHPKLIPRQWTFESYISAWISNRKIDPDSTGLEDFINNTFRTGFGRFLIISLLQASLVTIGQVILSVLAAYAFAVLKFPGRNFLFTLVLGSLMIPPTLTFIPISSSYLH